MVYKLKNFRLFSIVKKLFENWRKYQNQKLNERAGPLVYASDASAGFEKARELDRERKADRDRARKEALAVIKARRKEHPILSEALEQLIEKIVIVTAGMAAASQLPYILSQLASGSNTLRGGRLGGKRVIRKFLQKALTRWVPLLGWAMLINDIYNYFLSEEAIENREELIRDFKEIVELIKIPTTPTV